MKKLRVYHGSTVIVENPSVDILNYKTDFGKGFYTTLDCEQAKRWTKIKKERLEIENQSQDSFHTDKALKTLNYIGTEEVEE